MENNSEDEESNNRLRRAAIETVLRYSVENNPFYNDERLLYVFSIVVSNYNSLTEVESIIC